MIADVVVFDFSFVFGYVITRIYLLRQ
uniref:Uncharacterized protein n=1 Tax=Rhizophora mucronata TaxID=61149 RepID=A0A2P2QT87_RHIMU